MKRNLLFSHDVRFKSIRTICFLISCLFVSSQVSGQLLFNYTDDSGGAPVFVDAGTGANAISLGGGVSTMSLNCTGAADGIGATGWPTTNTFNVSTFNMNGDFFEVKLWPNPGYGLTVTGFSARLRRENNSGTVNDGPIAARYAYRVGSGGSGAWTSGVNPGNPQSSNVCASSGVQRTWPSFSNFQVSSGDTLYFRIYGLSSGANMTGDFVLHNVEVSGYSCAAPPIIVLGDDPQYCVSDNAIAGELAYDTTSGNTYDLSIPDLGISVTGQHIPVSPITFTIPAGTMPGSYDGTITVSNACGFISDPAAFTVIINPLPDAEIAVAESSGNNNDDGDICAGASVVLTASGGMSYSWSTGETTAEITVTPTETTTYTVTVTSAEGCTATAQQTVTVHALPVAGITVTDNSGIPDDNQTCAGDTITLTASTGSSYFWNTEESSQSIDVAPASDQTYTVVISNEDGCSAEASVSIVVNPYPAATLSVSSAAICPGTAIDVTFNESAYIGHMPPVDFTVGTDVSTPVNGQDTLTFYNAVDGDFITLTEGTDFTGDISSTDITVTANQTGCSTHIATGPSVDVHDSPVFGFSAQVGMRDTVSGSNENGPVTVTMDFCDGESFCLFPDNIPANIGFIEEIIAGSGNLLYGGSTPIPATRPASYNLTPGSAAFNFFSGCYGSYDLQPGETSGFITQTFTPYLDADNSGGYTPGDCLGNPITLQYNVYGAPTGTTDSTTVEICSGSTTDINLSSNIPGTTFSWTADLSSGMVSGQADGSGSTIAQTLTGNGVVTYTITPAGPAPNNCPGDPFDVVVNVHPALDVTVTLDNSTICTGGTVVLTFHENNYPGANFTATTSGTDDDTTGTLTVPFIEDGDQLPLTEGVHFHGTLTLYDIVVTLNGTPACSQMLDTIRIVVNPPSEPEITGPTCVHVGSNMQLTGDPGVMPPAMLGTAVWSSSDPMIASVDAGGVVTGVSAGTVDIYYTVTDNAGCVAVDTLTISVLDDVQLHLSAIETPVGCGGLMKIQVTADNFCDLTGLDFTVNWDSDLFEFADSSSSALGSFNLTDAPGQAVFNWSSANSTSLDPDSAVLCFYLKAISNSGNDEITTSDEAASNSFPGDVAISGDFTDVEIIPLSLAPDASVYICPNETTASLHYCDLVGNADHWQLNFDMDAQDAGFPPFEGGTLTPDSVGCGDIVFTIPFGLQNSLLHATLVISNTTTDCASPEYAIEMQVDNQAPYGIIDPMQATLAVQCVGDVPAPDNSVVINLEDNCTDPGDLVITSTDVNDGGAGCNGDPLTITRTYTITDEAGNHTDVIQTIVVKDDTPPTIANGFVLNGCFETEQEVRDYIDQNIGQYLSDNCSTPSVDSVVISQIYMDSCKYSVAIFVVDECGNLTMAPDTYVVNIDSLPPVIAPGGVLDDCYEILMDDDPMTVDAVQDALDVTRANTSDCSEITFTTQVIDLNDHCQYQIIVTATDPCGHTASTDYTVRVDNTPPIFTLDTDSTALDGACFQTGDDAIDAAVALTHAEDACSEPTDLTYSGYWEFDDPDDCVATLFVEVTDYCGNVATIQYPNVRIDDTAPVIPDSLPSTVCFKTPADAQAALEAFASSISEDCTPAGELETSSEYTLITGGECESGEVTVTVTDCAGNFSEVTYPVDIDSVAPVFDSIPELDVVCFDDIPPVDSALLATIEGFAHDSCSEVTAELIDEDIPVECGPDHAGHRTFQVTDCAGNTAIRTQTIILNDTIAPIWEDGVNSSTLVCSCEDTACQQDLLAFVPNAEDNGCLGAFVTLISSSDTTIGCERTIIRVWSAADYCGNSTMENFTQTIHIIDNEAPTFDPDCQFMPPMEIYTSDGYDCPADADISIAVNDTISLSDTWTVAGYPVPELGSCVQDNCTAPEDIVVRVADIQVSDTVQPCARMITLSLLLSDACGNTNPDSFVCQYLIIDDNAPIWSIPDGELDRTVQCSDAGSLAIAQGLAPAAIDNCDASPVVTKTSGSFVADGSCPQAGSYTNFWIATDCSGNVSDTFTQVIHVIDNQAPTWADTPGELDRFVSCSDMAGLAAAQALVPEATDSCDGALTPVKNAGAFVPGACPGTGSYTNTFTVTDDCGNTSTVYTQTIQVADTTAPVLTAGTIGTCYNSAAAAEAAALDATMASDNCSTVTTTVATSGDCSAVITVTATDCAGNSASVTYNTRIDAVPPTVVAGTIASCYPDVASAEIAAKTATTRTDNCPGGLSISAVTVGTCPATITITVTDGCGNSASVQYEDVCIGGSGVTITTEAMPTTVDCSIEADSLASWLAVHGGAISDPADATWSHSTPVFTLDCMSHSRTATVTFTASDNCGHSDVTTATFTVTDNVAPTVSPLPTLNLTCTSEIPDPSSIVTMATDNCDNSLTAALYSNSNNGGSGCPGDPLVLVRTYSVTDDYCNTTYVSQTINVVDNVAPTFTAPANATVYAGTHCIYDASVAVTGDVTNEADNCSSGLNATFSDNVVAGVNYQEVSVITRTWSLTDNCGNVTTHNQIVTVKDTTPPSLVCPVAVSMAGQPIEGESCAWVGSGLTPSTFYDNCDGPVLSYTLDGFFEGSGSGLGSVDGTTFLEGETTVTYTATDAYGNTTSCSFIVSVNCTTVSGTIIWEADHSQGVKNATVRLFQGMTQVGSDLSDVNGDYSISASTFGAHTISPVKNINRFNGVDAVDASLIMQHVNGSMVITDPYKKIAADVNHNGFITTTDATIITNALNGNAAALAAFNIFWRFAPTSYVMPTTPPPIVPSFPENISINITGPDITDQDFYGIKIGDVNGTANPALLPDASPLTWFLQDQTLEAGKEYELYFNANEFKQYLAFQFALDFDPSQIKFQGVESLGAITLNSDNFGAANTDLGEFRVVWANAEGVTLTDGTPVFKIKFKALTSGQKLSDVINLDESVLSARAYNTALAASPLRVVFLESTATDSPLDPGKPQLQLLQNKPNPFTDATTIGFVLPAACDAEFRVMDVSGRELSSYKRSYSAGYHEVDFRMENATAYGVLYYELVTPYGTLTKKMIAGGK